MFQCLSAALLATVYRPSLQVCVSEDNEDYVLYLGQ